MWPRSKKSTADKNRGIAVLSQRNVLFAFDWHFCKWFQREHIGQVQCALTDWCSWRSLVFAFTPRSGLFYTITNCLNKTGVFSVICPATKVNGIPIVNEVKNCLQSTPTMYLYLLPKHKKSIRTIDTTSRFLLTPGKYSNKNRKTFFRGKPNLVQWNLWIYSLKTEQIGKAEILSSEWDYFAAFFAYTLKKCAESCCRPRVDLYATPAGWFLVGRRAWWERIFFVCRELNAWNKTTGMTTRTTWRSPSAARSWNRTHAGMKWKLFCQDTNALSVRRAGKSAVFCYCTCCHKNWINNLMKEDTWQR